MSRSVCKAMSIENLPVFAAVAMGVVTTFGKEALGKNSPFTLKERINKETI